MDVKRKKYTPSDVGPSPLEWTAPRLSEVSTLITNGFVGTATPYYTDETGVPYLYGTNVRADRLDPSGIRYITKEFHESQLKTELKTGDLLTVQSGHIGETAVVSPDFAGANCHALIVTRLIQNKADPQYLSYYLNSEIGRARMKGLEVGSTILHINTKDLKKFRVLLPSLQEQYKIAQIISTWDKAITTVEQMLANSQQQKKSLMQQLLTGRKRFPGYGSEWVSKKIGELVKEVKRPVNWDDESEYKLLSVKRRSEGIVLREVLKGYQILTKKMNVAKAGDFLISKMQVVHGASGLVTEQFDGYHVSDSYIALIPKDSEILDIEFFSWISKQLKMYHKAFLCSYGVHIEKMTFNINMYLRETLKIPPTIEEQKKIAFVLSKAEFEVNSLKQKLATLKQEKKALMQKLLTGKNRVKVDEVEVA